MHHTTLYCEDYECHFLHGIIFGKVVCNCTAFLVDSLFEVGAGAVFQTARTLEKNAHVVMRTSGLFFWAQNITYSSSKFFAYHLLFLLLQIMVRKIKKQSSNLFCSTGLLLVTQQHKERLETRNSMFDTLR